MNRLLPSIATIATLVGCSTPPPPKLDPVAGKLARDVTVSGLELKVGPDQQLAITGTANAAAPISHRVALAFEVFDLTGASTGAVIAYPRFEGKNHCRFEVVAPPTTGGFRFVTARVPDQPAQ